MENIHYPRHEKYQSKLRIFLACAYICEKQDYTLWTTCMNF